MTRQRGMMLGLIYNPGFHSSLAGQEVPKLAAVICRMESAPGKPPHAAFRRRESERRPYSYWFDMMSQARLRAGSRTTGAGNEKWAQRASHAPRYAIESGSSQISLAGCPPIFRYFPAEGTRWVGGFVPAGHKGGEGKDRCVGPAGASIAERRLRTSAWSRHVRRHRDADRNKPERQGRRNSRLSTAGASFGDGGNRELNLA